VPALAEPGLHRAAIAALAAIGPEGIPELQHSIADAARARTVRRGCAAALGRMRHPAAVQVLLKLLFQSSEDVRDAVLDALVVAEFRADPGQVRQIQESARREAADAAWTLSAIESLTTAGLVGPAPLSALIGALRREVDLNRDRSLVLLSFVHGRELLQARRALGDGMQERRAFAMEVVDSALPQEVKGYVLPLVEPLDTGQRLAQLSRTFPQSVTTPAQTLGQLIERPADRSTIWTTVCAIYVAGYSRDPALAGMLDRARMHPSDIVRETAEWAAARLQS
jgi:hypothetical protein